MKKLLAWKDLIAFVVGILYLVYVVVLRIVEGSAGIHSVAAVLIFLSLAVLVGNTKEKISKGK